MKITKKQILLVITLAVVSLLVASPINITAKENPPEKQTVDFVKLENELKSLQIKKTDLNIQAKPFPKQIGYPEFDDPGDQVHPGVARSLDTGYMAAYKDVDYGELVWVHSEAEDGVYFELGGDYPSVKLWEGSRFFATLVPDSDDSNAGIIYLFETTDNRNIETYTLVGWDWSDNGWSDIIDIEIACDGSKEDWEWGVVSMVASTSYGDGVTDGPFISYQTSEDGYATISWYIGVDGCAHTDNVIDHETYKAYCAYDWHNSEGNRWELLIRIDYYDDWEAQGAMYEYYEPGTNYQYPAVSSYNDNIVTVFQTDENTNNDIKCFYGTDLETLKESFVAQTVDDETHPDIQHISGEIFLCTFVKNGNLYGSLSENAGQTWSGPWMISNDNGAVVAEYKTSDLSERGLQTMWGETGDDIDIWINWAPDNNPPEAPSITGETNGKANTEYQYTFSSTDLEGETLEYYINWGDETSIEWDGPHSSGESIDIGHTWIESESTYTITAKARDVNGIESLWGSLEVATPKNVAEDSIIIKLLEKLIDLFPLLGPLLQPIINQM